MPCANGEATPRLTRRHDARRPGYGHRFVSLQNDSRAQRYLPHLYDQQWLISFMTEAELEQWALLSNWHAKRIEWLRAFLGRFVIVPSSHDLVLKWAEVMVVARRNGRRLETADAWIASTATLYGAPLITHNGSDYLGVPGLNLITEAAAT